ncbi:hypothetical protein [Duganella sp. BJB1802]|uniref:hypothetical protein n=1 Tax=Duganella sp. BJB1802 TaxID=2744575 RepID=UPI001E393DD7|nr:hypothetical protein [Duganella sp. BJB1802]
MKLKTKISLLSAAVALCCGGVGAQIGAAGEVAAPAATPWMNAQLGAEERASPGGRGDDRTRSLARLRLPRLRTWNRRKTTRPAPSHKQSAGFHLRACRAWASPTCGKPTPAWAYASCAGSGRASRHGAAVGPEHGRHLGPEHRLRGRRYDAREARACGFNVPLAGGVNLMREPRNGRNFEYAGEDPRYRQDRLRADQGHPVEPHRVHARNSRAERPETNRTSLNVKIDDRSARMSDLSALQIANEEGNPGA